MKTIANTKERLTYLDLLRIISIFFMIGIHVVGITWYTAPIQSFSWQVMNIYDSIFRICVPIFVMISGSLFLDQNKNITISKLFTKNILRIFIALLFWSLIYGIFHCIILSRTLTVDTIILTLKEFVRGHYHLWFIPMLIGLYIITPILRKLCENKKIEEYFLILGIIFNFGWITIQRLIPYSINVLDGTIFDFNISLILGYSTYFVLGHYLNTYPISINKEITSYILGIVGLLFTILGTVIISFQKGEPTHLYDNMLLNIFLASLAFFILFKNRISKVNFSTKTVSNITFISNLCFGIYLIHDFFITILTRYEINALLFNSLISIPLIILLVFLLSFIITYIISKIPIIHKYII